MGAQGTAIIDFSTTPSDEATVTVTGQAGIIAGSHVEAFVMRESHTDNDVDEHEMLATLGRMVCGNIVAGTGFDIKCELIGLLAINKFNVRWVWN